MVNESSELKFEVQSPLANDGNKSEGSVLTSLKEIQSWWEVASIVHFSSVFRPAFDLPEFEFDVSVHNSPCSKWIFRYFF